MQPVYFLGINYNRVVQVVQVVRVVQSRAHTCALLMLVWVRRYSSLGTQWKGRLGWNPVLTHPILRKIAEQNDASVPRVVLAWIIQRGAAAIPASRTEEHVHDLFRSGGSAVSLQLHLPEKALAAIDALDSTFCNGDVWQCTTAEKPFA